MTIRLRNKPTSVKTQKTMIPNPLALAAKAPVVNIETISSITMSARPPATIGPSVW
jgi:hypothetical protein